MSNPLHEALAEYIADKNGVDPKMIQITKVSAQTAYRYSTYTTEDYGCDIEYQYGGRWGRKGYYSLNDREIVEFFNHEWEKRGVK